MLARTPLHERITSRIAAAAVAPHGRLAVPPLIRLLQEAAMRNTRRLGISSPELMAQYGLSWVLRRQVIRAERWPGLGEEITILTAPTRTERNLLTYRDFHLHDAHGAPLLTATTCWVLIDLVTRRPARLPVEVTRLADDFPPAAAQLPWPTAKLRPPATPTAERQFRVGFADLDFNDHLTNPVFPELMLEPLGHRFLRYHLPTELDVTFLQEARYGEVVVAHSEPVSPGPAFRHTLFREEERLATMYTKWTPLP